MNAGAVVVAVLFVAGVWWLVRKKVARRLALRNARRRPTETVLVIGGSLLGAALITGSLIVGDTLDASIRATARTQLGPVDEILTLPVSAVAATAEERLEGLEDDRIDGVISLVEVQASISSRASGKVRAEPDARLVELDFEAGRSFGGDLQATGISGTTPGPGEVVITEDLAATLDAGAGDRVTTYLYGRRDELEVDGVVPRLGLAGLWLGFESTSPNAFVAPGTIAKAAPNKARGAVPPLTRVAISNRGGVEDGVGLSDEVAVLVEKELGPSAAFRVETVKKDRLDSAEDQGQQFSELFLSIGAFAVLAGVLLLVNIFVMLSEERKTMLGMLRAIGLTRADLLRLFIIEGTLYAVVASALGAGAGIGVGWAIVKLAAPIFGGGGDFSLDLAFSLTPESLRDGFVVGFVISVVTVVFTSVRISRINIIRAIRDLPEPPRQGARLIALAAGIVLAAVMGAAFIALLGDESAWVIAILSPPVAAFGLLPLAGRIMGRRRAVLLAASGSLVWGIFGNTLLDGQFFDSGEIVAFVFQGVLLTFAAVVLLTQLQEEFEGGLRRLAASRLALRLGLAYPLAHRFRTGLTLGMYALVVFTMTFIAVLSNVFGGQVDRATRDEAGGFDMLVTASEGNPPPARVLTSIPGVGRVSSQVHGTALFRPPGFTEPQPWPVTGIERSFVDIGPPALEERAGAFSSDREVWNALVEDPGTAVIDSFFLEAGGGGPPASPVELGEEMEVLDPVTGKPVTRRVIAVTGSGQSFSGVFMGRDSVEEVFSGRVAANRFYVVATGSPEALDDIAGRMQGEFVRNGVEAQSFRSIIEEGQRLNLQFLQLMQGYLALGLVVGIAGLGVVMIRAVRERRREIGVLRALGFVAPMVRRAFLLESGFTALEGILVGSGLALVTAAQLVSNGDFGEGLAFNVPWADVTFLCVISLVASLLATSWPAHQAAGIPPAVALRVAE